MGEAVKQEAVPKEGSMEDILASIRRIISADSSPSEKPQRIEPTAAGTQAVSSSEETRPVEPARKPMTVDAQKPVTGSLSALADQIRSERGSASSMNPVAAKLEQQRSDTSIVAPPLETTKPAPSEVAADAKPAEKPSTLSALAQQVSGSAGKPTSIATEAEKQEPVKTEPPALTKVEPTPAKADGTGLSLKELANKVSEAAKPISQPQLQNKPDVLASAIGAAAKTEQDDKASGEKPIDPKEPENPAIIVDKTSDDKSLAAFKDALVAPSTQAAVSDSMDRLRKSVEDVDAAQVENILRPMLKTWLDDNLPSMVERMVQQEISKITARKQA